MRRRGGQMLFTQNGVNMCTICFVKVNEYRGTHTQLAIVRFPQDEAR